MFHNFDFIINNHMLIHSTDENKYKLLPTIYFATRYNIPLKTKVFNKEMNWDIILEYTPKFTYGISSPLFMGSIQNQITLIRNFGISLKFGFAELSKFEPSHYISFAPEITYELPVIYNFISTSFHQFN